MTGGEPPPGDAVATILLDAETLRTAGPEASLPAGRLVVDLGFGRAEALIELARAQPDLAFLGVEVSRKRAHKAARRVARAGLENLRIVHATAEYLIARVLPPGSVSECWINFPDPWPKKRHHKRRLLRPGFLRELVGVLEPRGLLHVATDHPGYAEWIAAAAEEVPELEGLHAPKPWSHARPKRPGTSYEEEFVAEGRTIAYFDYRRRAGAAPAAAAGGSDRT